MWFEKSLYFPYYFAIFSIQLYMYIFKKIAPILSPIFLLEVIVNISMRKMILEVEFLTSMIYEI